MNNNRSCDVFFLNPQMGAIGRSQNLIAVDNEIILAFICALIIIALGYLVFWFNQDDEMLRSAASIPAAVEVFQRTFSHFSYRQ